MRCIWEVPTRDLRVTPRHPLTPAAPRPSPPPRRIKELGTLPSDAFEKYRGKGVKVRAGRATNAHAPPRHVYTRHPAAARPPAHAQQCVAKTRSMRPPPAHPPSLIPPPPPTNPTPQPPTPTPNPTHQLHPPPPSIPHPPTSPPPNSPPNSQDLHRARSGVQESLSRYAHVNRKALDQYVNFTEQREELHRRRDEVLQGGAPAGGGGSAGCVCVGAVWWQPLTRSRPLAPHHCINPLTHPLKLTNQQTKQPTT
jgi:hypothetical protein